MRNKAVRICILVFFVISLVTFIFSNVFIFKEKQNQQNINEKISRISKETDKVVSDNENYKLDIENKKVEVKEKLEEEEIWKKMEEKISQAL